MLQATPPEMVRHVSSFLPLHDLRNFRLVCRTFASVGARWLVTEVSFCYTKPSLQRLLLIASHRDISRGVRSLVYEPFSLPTSLSYEQWRAVAPGAAVSKIDLDLAYEQYRRASREQEEVWESNLDFQMILQACRTFPNLDRLTVGTVKSFELQCPFRADWRAEPAALPCKPFLCELQREGCTPGPPRCLPSAILACSEAGVVLESFTSHGLSWRSLAQLANPKCLRSLHSLTIVVQVGTAGLNDDISQCRAFLAAGTLRTMLGSLLNLRTLRVEFLCPQPSNGYVELETVFGSGFWPHLEELEFGGMESSHTAFRELLLRHRNTLQCLTLGDLRLTGDSPLRTWKEALAVLGDLHLRGIDLRKRISCMTLDGPCSLVSVLWLGTTGDDEDGRAAMEELCSFAIRPASHRARHFVL